MIWLYFTSRDCGPCKVFKPRVAKFCAENHIPLFVVSCDTPTGGRTADRRQVEAVPTIIVLNSRRGQNEHGRLVGRSSTEDLKNLHTEALKARGEVK